MLRYVNVSVLSGILFGILDGLVNANALGRRLNEVYKPIARPSVNVRAGILIDLAYGFVLAGLFVLLYHCLPGSAGVVKGLCFALLVWFLRVVMGSVSQAMVLRVPAATTAYGLLAGLAEMLVLGLAYGLALWPEAWEGALHGPEHSNGVELG